MERIQILQNQLAGKGKSQYVDSAIDFLSFAKDFLTPEEEKFRQNLRAFLEKEIAPYVNEYVEKAEFPTPLVNKFKQADIMKHFMKPPFGTGLLSSTAIGVCIAEMSRIDLGVGTFWLLLLGLVYYTLDAFCSQEQKEKWIPQVRDLNLIGAWGLTEQKIGSDAGNISTSVKKVQGGYILNGDKRWIGNGNKEFILVWARNQDNKKVECFYLDMKTQGVTSQVIKHKLAMRIVQNCQITFNNVFIPEENKLPGAVDFSKSTAQVLLHSRCFVSWLAAGICLGVYDNAIKYSIERKQFGVPIASYQLQQERLARIMGNTQAILLLCSRITQLLDKGKVTIGKAAMTKAWVTERTREVARIGREMFGGNGIISDYYVMKAVTDAEVTYTYEGTYDINSLVTGRELTGISAFQVPKKN